MIQDKRSNNLKKLQIVIDMMHNLPKKIPNGKELEKCEYKGSNMLKYGTLKIRAEDNKGVMITTEELYPFIQYLEQCKTNGEVEGMVLDIFAHSNNKKLNSGFGISNYRDADFASINIITSKINLKMTINQLHPISRKIGHLVKVNINN